jgi:uncharacterized protein (TIGR03437 family)
MNTTMRTISGAGTVQLPRHSRLACGLAILALAPGASRGQTLFSTFGPAETFVAGVPGASVGAGVLGGFTSGGIQVGYAFMPSTSANLSRVDLGMEYIYDPVKASGPADVNVTIAADNGGQPGAILETIAVTGALGSIPSGSGIVSAYSVAKPALQAGVQYWLLVGPPDLRNTTFDWLLSPGGQRLLQTSNLGGIYWESPYQNTAMAFAIFGGQNSGLAGNLTAGGLVDAASFRSTISAGSWMTVFGTNLSATTRAWQASDFVNGALPLSLDGVGVQVNGYPAAVSYISPGQVNAQVPDGVGPGTVTVQVVNAAGGSSLGQVNAQAYAPGFFTFGSGGMAYVAAVNADGVVIGKSGLLSSDVPTQPAHPGDMISIYASGFGPTTPSVAAGQMFSGVAPLVAPGALTVTIGGLTPSIQFAGISAAGLYQFNVLVPSLADGDQPVMAQIDGASTQQPVYLTVANQ